jgi:glyoxylase-like metal-dependent hydrolase (beta-lactamase superfamily II)
MRNDKTRATPPEVAPGVFVIVLPWTRVYVLRAPQSGGENSRHDFARDEFFLVDSGTRADRAAILAALKLLEIPATNCRAVLLTHAHPDHAGNAAFFAQRGAQLFLHQAERIFLETRRTYIPRLPRALAPLGWLQTAMFALGEIFWPVKRVLANVVLHGHETLSTPCGAWRVLETPGHTRGHISFFREADGALLSGDALLNVVPFVMKTGLAVPTAIFNEDTAQARASARRLCALPVNILLAGHGPTLRENTSAHLREFAAELPP